MTSQVLAHTVVEPKETIVDTFETFTLSTHSEESSATVQFRLIIPDGVNYVTPHLKPGWKIQVEREKDPTTTQPRITAIVWNNASIPPGFHDEFKFIGQVPKTETTLNWKVYQSFADGRILSWDIDPNNKGLSTHDATNHTQTKDDSASHTFMSQTKVVKKVGNAKNEQAYSFNQLILLFVILSSLSLATSLAAFVRASKKKGKY